MKKALSIENDLFENLKVDFDDMLLRTVINMNSRGAEDGSISIKLNINLERDENGTCIRPSFSHNISSAVTIKDKVAGEMIGDYELIWDDENGNYALSLLDDGQETLFVPQS